MKKNLLKLAAFFGLAAFSGVSAKEFFVTNNTPFPASVAINWVGLVCSDDSFVLAPGERRGVSAGACLMRSVNATITQSASVVIGGITYQAQYTGANMANANKTFTASRYYVAGGQSAYTEFHIIGPGVNGQYHVVRIVQ